MNAFKKKLTSLSELVALRDKEASQKDKPITTKPSE